MVATPIGNIADISLRALHVLSLADTVACEDTRRTATLLQAYGLHRPLLAVHEHNEAQTAQAVVQHLREGQRVAYVSDAGTPCVSDPGARLCAAVMTAGMRVLPVPGPSSVTALLSVGAVSNSDGHFVFCGFLSPKASERQQALQAIATESRACVLLEAPHRIEALALDMTVLGQRPLTVGRELTKRFEEVAQIPAAQLHTWLQSEPHRTRGEFVLLVHPEQAKASDNHALSATELHTLKLLLTELPLKTAVKLCAQITGLPRNTVYAAALKFKVVD